MITSFSRERGEGHRIRWQRSISSHLSINRCTLFSLLFYLFLSRNLFLFPITVSVSLVFHIFNSLSRSLPPWKNVRLRCMDGFGDSIGTYLPMTGATMLHISNRKGLMTLVGIDKWGFICRTSVGSIHPMENGNGMDVTWKTATLMECYEKKRDERRREMGR